MNLRLWPKLAGLLPRLALAATLLLPVFLLHGRAIADILVTSVDVAFLLHSATSRDWRWTRRKWVWCAAGFWLLQLAASIHAGPVHSMFQAVAAIRLFLFVAALEAWVLPDASHRRALSLVFLAMVAWVGVEVWQQFLLGTNIWGYPRWSDGALTGPFEKPRAGAIFVLLVVASVFPAIIRILQKNTLAAIVLAAACFILPLATMLLIGQRMPTLLMVLAMALTGFLIPRLRRPLLIAGCVGIAALAALPVVSPPAYAKLVLKFIEQMSHFADSPYGQLYVRAAVMIGMNPLIGLGFDGFRQFCPDPSYFHDLPGLGITNTDIGAAACNIHPHNYYLEVAVMAGITGFVLFVAMLGLWFAKIIRSLRPAIDPQQAMLFVAVVAVFWPFASTSSLFVFDTAGWAILLTGWALAASRPEA